MHIYVYSLVSGTKCIHLSIYRPFSRKQKPVLGSFCHSLLFPYTTWGSNSSDLEHGKVVLPLLRFNQWNCAICAIYSFEPSFSSIQCFWEFSMLLLVFFLFFSFSLLYPPLPTSPSSFWVILILLHENTTIYLSLLLLMDIWAVSRFGQLWWKLYKCFCTSLFVEYVFISLG